MTTGVAAPQIIPQFWLNNGQLAAGGSILTTVGGINAATYQDQALTIPLPNPIPLNSRGEISNAAGASCQLFLTPNTVYVFTLFDGPNGTGNQIWQATYVNGVQTSLTASTIGLVLYPQTTGEIAASITPTNYIYTEGDLRRYGGDPTGAIDSSTAWQSAISVGIARIPKGCSFKIVTPATKTGQVTILGEGKTSKLLCDSTVLTVTTGTGSVVDNFWMENITAPWIITRNPTNWTLPPYATLQQSNTVLGYEPTVNDADVWAVNQFTASKTGTTMTVTALISGGVVQPGAQLTGAGITSGAYVAGQLTGPPTGIGTYIVSGSADWASTTVTTLALSAPQQNQQIGPTIIFTGLSTDIEVSRIYGRFVRIDLMDSQYSTVQDCDFRGGKGQWGGINFDNGTNNLIVGKGNKAIGNTIRYASFSGIIFSNNDGPLAVGNVCNLNGESGIKVGSGPNALPTIRALATGNQCNQNFYDGIDAADDVPTDDAIPSWDNISDNTCYQNGGVGVGLAGKFNICEGNLIQGNYRYGLWCLGSLSSIKGNFLIDNNQQRNPSYHEMLGGNVNNHIVGNFIWSGAGQNSSAIFATNTHYIADNYAIGSNFNFGTSPAAVTSYLLGNVDPTTGLQTEQSFIWGINNNAGTLQHTTYAQSGAVALGNFQNRILNAAAAPTNTPTGADASTPLAGGWKIGSGSPSSIWADTNDQLTAANALLMASVAYNDTGTEIRVRPQIVSININGVTRFRLTFQFFTAAGVAFALNTTNIPAGKTVQVQFYGKLT